MKRIAFVSFSTCIGLLAAASALNGGQPLILQVSPVMTAAPAVINVRAVIEASDENRALEIVAQSSEFFRGSRVELDGRNAPPLSVFQYSNLPPGLYEVSAFLIGTGGGQRAAVSKVVKVVSK